MNNIFKNNFFNLIDMENINLPIKCNKLTLNKNEEDEDEENEETKNIFIKIPILFMSTNITEHII